MQRTTVLFLALGLSLLPAVGAAATTGCAGTGGDAPVRSACCCSGDTLCEMPGSGAADTLTDACCHNRDSGTATPTPAPAPASTTPVQVEMVPVQGIATGISPVAAPRPPMATEDGVPQHPPHYTLFCSLLI